ncbi:MAG: hypothetical protein QOH64_2480 [Acidimicrobiaceae bacterium]
MSTRLVDRVSGMLASRTDRRGFLVRSAITGTALVAAPGTFVLRPTTAYAAVCSCSGSSCGCGSLCCDGYTEMCCTLSGTNRCPPGTYAGGWWKADGSGFCGDAPRYYIDCNVVPGQSPCGCGCANGDCDNRKSCCTVFRYGQCHQEVPSVTAIMCRVITCTPPWVFDRACTTTPATDNGTGGHDRPCLHNPIGNIDGMAALAPGRVRVVGWAADPDTSAPLDIDIYVDGAFKARTRADGSRPDIASALPGAGPNHGFDVTLDVPGNAVSLCAYAINQGDGSQNPLLACWPVPHNPFGSVDEVSQVPGQGYRVRGWAIDPDNPAPTDVHVYGDGALIAVLRADANRPDVAALLPAYGANHGYEAVIASGARNVCVYAINSGAGSSNTLLGCRVMAHEPFGNVELVAIVPDGGIRVKGWVIDPDTAGSISVDVYADGANGTRIVADIDRPDVAAAYPGHGQALGYDVVLPFPDARSVCVYGINAGAGGNALLGCRQLAHEPFGSLDGVTAEGGGLRVRGWAVDPDRAGPIDVHVYVDGRIAAMLTANGDRPDIAAVFPGYGATHGYDTVIAVPRGNHYVCAYAINQAAGSTNPTLGCTAVAF